jgi:hypothetical protein
MAERHVVAALRAKYARLKGELAHYATDDPEATMLALSQVGSVLRMFAPEADLSTIRPVRPHTPRQGRWTRLALLILRCEGQPLTARQLARRVIGELGLDQRDPRTVSTIECSLHATLAALEGQGIERVSVRPKRWALARVAS